MLSDERIREIKERCEKATKGPWTPGREDMQSYDGATGQPFSSVYADDDRAGLHMGHKLPLVIARIDGKDIEAEEEKSNARFIAHARTDIPDLLAEIERLRGELAARPVLQSRNKSDAIRIGATESLIPKEKD